MRGLGIKASQAFSPNKVAGLVIQLDTSDIGTIIDSGSPNFDVSRWNDKSKNGNDTEQLTGGQQPTLVSNVLNGNPAIRFGGGQSLRAPQSPSLDLAGNCTFFAVIHPSGSGDPFPQIFCKSLTGNANDNYRWRFNIGALQSSVLIKDSATTFMSITSSALVDLSSPTIQSAKVDFGLGNVSFRQDGIGIGTPALSLIDINVSVGVLEIGATTDGSEFFDGDMFEILIYNNALSLSDTLAIEGYLSNKWGIPVP